MLPTVIQHPACVLLSRTPDLCWGAKLDPHLDPNERDATVPSSRKHPLGMQRQRAELAAKRLQLESLLLAGNVRSARIPREVDNLSFLSLSERFLSLCLFAFKSFTSSALSLLGLLTSD